jgi:hypothetical protein
MATHTGVKIANVKGDKTGIRRGVTPTVPAVGTNGQRRGRVRRGGG